MSLVIFLLNNSYYDHSLLRNIHTLSITRESNLFMLKDIVHVPLGLFSEAKGTVSLHHDGQFASS
jgi:hypothetical protein